MTFAQIRDDIRDELSDNGVTYYSSDDIFDSMQDGYDEITVIAQQIEKMVVLPVQDDLVYYNFYELIPDYIRPFAIWLTSPERWISQRGFEFISKKIRNDWEKGRGNPRSYMVRNFQYVAIYPRLKTGVGNFEVFYKAKAPAIELGDTPIIPTEFSRILNYYCLADLLEQSEEFTKALMHLQKYQDILNSLMTHVEQRSQPDRINVLREQFTGGSFYGR